MFGKLIKYDFRSYFKSLLPVWGAILVLAVINGFTLRRGDIPSVEGFNAFFTFVLPLMLFICSFVAMGVITLVLIIQRFYQGLLGSEGYLMFTLPVSRSQLIGSKLTVSVVVQLISGLVICLAGLILGALLGREQFLAFIPEAFSFIRDLFKEEPRESWAAVLIILEILVLGLSSTAGNALHLYAAMSLGHLSRKQRVAASVLAWVGLNIVVTNLGGRFLFRLVDIDYNWMNTPKDFMLLLLVLILSALLLDAIYWAVSEWILKKKLNLE